MRDPIVSGPDIRLWLILGGIALCMIALKPFAVLDEFQRVMGDGKIIAPICTAMGFAFVLRKTGCDKHMVRMLIKPIRHVPWLLLPGGCAIGFVVNIAVTSQTASAAAVGPILIPLMLAAGYAPVIAAATLVLGCSAGGNLLNPGEPDIVNIASATGAAVPLVLERTFRPELAGFITAVATLFGLNILRAKRDPSTSDAVSETDEETPTRINYLKALLPPLPVLLLLLSQPKLGVIPAIQGYPEGLPVPHAMIIGTIIVMLVHWRDFSDQSRSFFSGLGYAYVHVISLIIAASCFIAGLTAIGAIKGLVSLVSDSGVFGKVAALVLPMMLAIVSGSGTAPSVGFSQAVLPSIAALDVPGAIDLGVLGAIGATFGRTMSPVAAVVIFTTTLTDATAGQIVRTTCVPLLVGAIAAFVVSVML